MPVLKHADFEVPGFGEFSAPPVAVPAYADTVLALGLLGFWRLGETAGTILADQTATHPLTLSGLYVLNQPGALITDNDAAARFASGSAAAASAVVPVGAGDPFSLVFWIRADTAPAADTPFMGQYVSAQPGSLFITYMTNGTVRYTTIGDPDFFTVSTVSSDWRMLVFTRDAAGDVCWYSDGRLDAQAAGHSTAVLDSVFKLGGVLPSSPGVVLDEVAVFDYALTPAEVRWLHGLAVAQLALPAVN